MKKLLIFFVLISLLSCTTDNTKVKKAIIEYSKGKSYEVESVENLKVLSKHRTTYSNSGEGTKYRYKATIIYKDKSADNCYECTRNIFIADSGEIAN